MIHAPQPVITIDPDDRADMLAEEAHGPSKVRVKRVPLIHTTDPDKEIENLFKLVDTRIVEVDAKLVERTARDRSGRRICEVAHYPTLNALMRSPTIIKNIREAHSTSQLKEIGERFVELKESRRTREYGGLNQGFALGLYDDEAGAGGSANVFRIGDTFLPSTVGPAMKQMLWADYLDAHRKCFEAATKNPLAKRICKIIPQFVLGRGVTGTHQDPKYQAVWRTFYRNNLIRMRLKMFLRELIIYGEIFLRYFNTRDGLMVRSLDPSTIWDIITEPDDLENVLYYHQQYVIVNRSVVPDIRTTQPSTLVIRQIPAADIDHFKINSTSSEKRGRSELLPILGWLLRFKEFANDRVLLNKIRSMFALDVTVEGTPTDVEQAEQQFATPPGSGAVIIHNKTVAVEFKSTNTGAGEAHTDAELLLKIIAIGAGVSEQFLGVSQNSSRAGALIQTEPDVKNFEDYQESLEHVLHRMSNRVFIAKGLKEPDEDTIPTMEFVFPAIAAEDRSSKIKDVGFMESMDYFSKRRAAEMGAREFGVSTYDFDAEQKEIADERKKQPKISLPMQQVPKEGPTSPLPPPGMPGGVGGPPLPAPAAPFGGGPKAGAPEEKPGDKKVVKPVGGKAASQPSKPGRDADQRTDGVRRQEGEGRTQSREHQGDACAHQIHARQREDRHQEQAYLGHAAQEHDREQGPRTAAPRMVRQGPASIAGNAARAARNAGAGSIPDRIGGDRRSRARYATLDVGREHRPTGGTARPAPARHQRDGAAPADRSAGDDGAPQRG
jgi:hypothetical protein